MYQHSFKRPLFKACLAGMALLASMTAQAKLVTLEFSADFALNLNQAFGGTTLDSFADSVYGAGTGTGGTVNVNGSMTFDSDTPAYQVGTIGNKGNANYLSPITGADVRFWGNTFVADVVTLNTSRPYQIQTSVSGNVGCLGDKAYCSGTPTSNAGLVSNNVLSQVINPNGTFRYASRDAFALFMGGAINEDFTALVPALGSQVATAPNGDQLLIWSMSLSAVSEPDENLWNTTALPKDASFFDPDYLDAVNLQLVLIGLTNNGNNAFAVPLSGPAATFRVTSPVPEAESYAMMLVGLGLIGLLRRIRNRG